MSNLDPQYDISGKLETQLVSWWGDNNDFRSFPITLNHNGDPIYTVAENYKTISDFIDGGISINPSKELKRLAVLLMDSPTNSIMVRETYNSRIFKISISPDDGSTSPVYVMGTSGRFVYSKESQTESLPLSVDAINAVDYTWYVDDVVIVDAIEDNIEIPFPVITDNSGVYKCTMTGKDNSITSVEFIVNIHS